MNDDFNIAGLGGLASVTNDTTIAASTSGYYSVDPAVGSFSVSGSTSTSSWYTLPAIMEELNIENSLIAEQIEKFLENDDEICEMVKNYLHRYLMKVVDNPEEVISTMLSEKDKKIESLKTDIQGLRNTIDRLEYEIRRLEDQIRGAQISSPVSIPSVSPYPATTDPWANPWNSITWSSSSLSGDGSEITAINGTSEKH